MYKKLIKCIYKNISNAIKNRIVIFLTFTAGYIFFGYFIFLYYMKIYEFAQARYNINLSFYEEKLKEIYNFVIWSSPYIKEIKSIETQQKLKSQNTSNPNLKYTKQMAYEIIKKAEDLR